MPRDAKVYDVAGVPNYMFSIKMPVDLCKRMDAACRAKTTESRIGQKFSRRNFINNAVLQELEREKG